MGVIQETKSQWRPFKAKPVVFGAIEAGISKNMHNNVTCH